MTDHDGSGFGAPDCSDEIEDLCERGAAISSAVDKNLVKRGIRAVLLRLMDFPSGTWQMRWVAADGDNHLDSWTDDLARDLIAASRKASPELVTRRAARTLRLGLMALVGLGVLRPGPSITLSTRWRQMHTDTLTRHADSINAVIDAAANDGYITKGQDRNARYALAALIATTGKPLREITVDEWVTVERTRRDLLKDWREWENACAEAERIGAPKPPLAADVIRVHQLTSLRWPYAAVVRAGQISPRLVPVAGQPPIPPTLDMAMARPRTFEGAMEKYEDVLTGRLYDLVRDTLITYYSGHDHSTVKNVVGHLVTFMRAVRVEMPGHASLDVPREVRAAVLARLQHRKPRGDETALQPREAVHLVLQTVRRFYEYADLLVSDEGRAEYADLLGKFPFNRHVVSQLDTAYRQRSESAMHAHIRDRIALLDDLAPAARAIADDAQRLLSLAAAASEGDVFEHGGRFWARAVSEVHPGSRRKPVGVRCLDRPGVAWIDVRLEYHRALLVWAAVACLRHTGLRIEELAELAMESLGFAQIDGADVPAIQIRPSKQNRTRTIPLHEEALEAFLVLIQSYKDLYGEVPEAHRWDAYEQEVLPVQRFLFQHHHRAAFVSIHETTVRTWIEDLIQKHNDRVGETGGNRLRPIRPHDFRRMFCTDLLGNDTPIQSVSTLMGHQRLDTTAIYDHTAWEHAAASFLGAHRRAANSRTGRSPCEHCGGTGYVTEGDR